MPSVSSVDTLRESIDALSPAVRSVFLASLSDENKTLSSSSPTKWADFFVEHQTEFGFRSLSFEYSNYCMENDITPTYQLPRSFHKEVCKIAMLWTSAYSFKRKDRTEEEANLRMLEPVRYVKPRIIHWNNSRILQFLIPITALFQGRILDKPQERMIKTKYSTGGRVEHEVSISS